MPRVTKPTTKARRARELEGRRSALLDAAEAVFREKGPVAATTDEVAERAGVSVGTIYNLFGSKDRLYGEVATRIAEDLVARTERLALEASDRAKAIEDLIVARISGFHRQRLFFALFSGESASGAYPGLETLPRRVQKLHRRYLELVASIIERGTGPDPGLIDGIQPLHLAVSLEGALNAFMGYWSGPSRSMPPEAQARHVLQTFLGLANHALRARAQPGDRPGMGPEPSRASEPHREIYITRFDLSRLTELIAVARTFGGVAAAHHLDALERELRRGRIVDPRAVPPDVVTMNSRVSLTSLETGRRQARRLVFPADAGEEEDALTVLDPLGTAILGCRAGSVVEVREDGEPSRYRIEELLYQPESAGDYHL